MATDKPDLPRDIRGAALIERAALLRRFLWHPQQKLWNRDLVDWINEKLRRYPLLIEFLTRTIIFADSILLIVRVIVRRMQLTGFGVQRQKRDRRPEVLLVDCGVHQSGFEIQFLSWWFSSRYHLRFIAFEAGARHFQAATANLAHVPNLELFHRALVGPNHHDNLATLYHWAVVPGGEGDSLYPSRSGGRYEVVSSVRLSEVLAPICANFDGPIVLRMNIEGSELFVIEDLIAARLHDRIDGFHGMWDDLSFIDGQAAARFQSLLHAHNIAPMTFNGRDLPYRLRRFAIRYDVQTSILHGERRYRERRVSTLQSRPNLFSVRKANRSADSPS